MAEANRVVHLVDDDESVRRAVSFMLRTSGYLVKTYGSGVAFLKEEPAPGCILLDVRMPVMDGLEVLQALRKRRILLPVIVMTAHGDVNVAVQAMKWGAVDFIEKPFEREVLLGAVEEGFSRLGQEGRGQARLERARAKLEKLSPREFEVLQGLVRGHPNKTIGYDLGISPRTVEIHRSNVMTKLEVFTLSDALRIAFAAGLGDAQADEPA